MIGSRGRKEGTQMRTTKMGMVAGFVLLALAACSSGGSAGSSSPTTGSSAASTTSSSSSAGGDVKLTVTAPVGAANSGYTEKTLSVPADTDFEIAFKNDDAGIPHNVQIFSGTSTTGTPVFAPDNNALITGVAETTYEVPGLSAGTYTFNCFAHPATMVGTLTVS